MASTVMTVLDQVAGGLLAVDEAERMIRSILASKSPVRYRETPAIVEPITPSWLSSETSQVFR